MLDIVDRLRKESQSAPLNEWQVEVAQAAMEEAADEIIRLRAKIDNQRNDTEMLALQRARIDELYADRNWLYRENTRLWEALHGIYAYTLSRWATTPITQIRRMARAALLQISVEKAGD